MPRNYNFIYSKLVENEYDVLGHIAYSIYKKQKISHIESLNKSEGREPADEELIPFNKISCSEESIEGYKIKAERVLQTFSDNVLEETINVIEENIRKEHADMLREVVEPLTPISKTRSFWNGVLQSVLGAFMFSCLVSLILVINRTTGGGLVDLFSNKSNKQTENIEHHSENDNHGQSDKDNFSYNNDNTK